MVDENNIQAQVSASEGARLRPGGRGRPGDAPDLDAGLWLTASPVERGIGYPGESITLPEIPGTGIGGLGR
jgi:hypothetical protein